jgi:WD40 repeat protein
VAFDVLLSGRAEKTLPLVSPVPENVARATWGLSPNMRLPRLASPGAPRGTAELETEQRLVGQMRELAEQIKALEGQIRSGGGGGEGRDGAVGVRGTGYATNQSGQHVVNVNLQVQPSALPPAGERELLARIDALSAEVDRVKGQMAEAQQAAEQEQDPFGGARGGGDEALPGGDEEVPQSVDDGEAQAGNSGDGAHAEAEAEAQRVAAAAAEAAAAAQERDSERALTKSPTAAEAKAINKAAGALAAARALYAATATATAARVRSPLAKRDGAGRQQEQPQQRRSSPWPRTFEALGQPALRRWATRFHPAVSMLEDSQPVRSLAFEPNGEYVAMGTNSRAIALGALPRDVDALAADAPALFPAALEPHEPQQAEQPQLLHGRPGFFRYTYERTAGSAPPRLALNPSLHKVANAHLGSVYCVEWSEGGPDALIASGSNDKVVKLWRRGAEGEVASQPAATLDGHNSTVRALRFLAPASSGQLLLASGGGGDNAVRVWDCTVERATATLRGHGAPVFALDRLGGLGLVSSGADGAVRLWDLRAAEACVAVLASPLQPQCGAHSVAAAPARSLLATGHEDGTLLLWDLKMRRCVRRDAALHSADVRSLSLSACGSWLLSGAFDGTVGITDTDGFAGGPVGTFQGHRGKVLAVQWHPTAPLFCSSGSEGHVKLWGLAERPQHDVLW